LAKTKSIIVCPGRCGSTLLIRSLKKYYPITEEVCSDVKRGNPEDDFIMDSEWAKYFNNDASKLECPEFLDFTFEHVDVVKLQYFQFINNPVLIEYMKKKNIIHLYRKNRLNRLVSERTARRNKRWHDHSDLKPVIISAFDIKNIIRGDIRLWEQVQETFDITTTITYEGLISDWERVIEIFQKQHQWKKHAVEKAVSQSITKPINEMILNYDLLQGNLDECEHYLPV
jgi:LPS sulfotransferase NodH